MRDKPDANAQELDRLLDAMQAYYVRMAPGQGYDRTVGHRGRILLIEYKDGAKAPSRRQLTPREAEVRADFAAVGVPVHVVTCARELQELLNGGPA